MAYTEAINLFILNIEFVILLFATIGGLVGYRFITKHNPEQQFSIDIDLYATKAIATEFSQYPDYDPNLKGPRDALKTLIEEIDGVRIGQTKIYQRSKFENMSSFGRDDRHAKIILDIIVDDVEEFDFNSLYDSIYRGIENDKRHDGVKNVNILHNEIPTKDVRTTVKDKMINDDYISMHNDKNKEKSILEDELEKSHNKLQTVKE